MEKWAVIKHYRDILDSEEGYILKNGSIKVATLYPNKYEIASQNLGFQEVYKFLNSIEDVVCERIVLDFYEDNLSIETQKFFAEFEVIFVSINYEEDVLNLIKFLKSQHIKIFNYERDSTSPLIIAGGVLTFLNPRLLLNVADIQLIGDLEPMKNDLISMLKNFSSKKERISFLTTLDYSVFSGRKDKAKVVHKKDRTPICSSIKTVSGEFANEFLVELSIGCKYGCRFCSASYIYRPYRIMDFNKFYEIIENYSFSDDIGIISAVFGDLPDIQNHIEKLKNMGKNVSVSSLRVDTLTENLILLLKDCNVKSITIAEETVSDKLKKIIKKEIKDEDIYNVVELIAHSGILNLKLYYMIGLPGETIDDVKLLIRRVEKIVDIFTKKQAEKFKRLGKVKLSINIFIPKPFTPMQYFPLEDKKSINNKIKLLNKELRKIPNLKFSIMSHSTAYLQATISRAEDNIDELYQLFLESNDIKTALKNFKSNAYEQFDENKQLVWEKLISHNFDINILKREFTTARKILEDWS
ncbi:MAG: hypothetical protein JG762_200 [Deferribacteraceae bacterium]|jgi:radical SAM superfamily enzyme YgiQ (UPF0313 family)|nr:hypothetical protein [Deferribacteraceae bacterium]